MAWLIGHCCPSSARAAETRADIDTDLLIVGGTESGVAAAIQAARAGVKSIVLVNDIEWLGGQFTAEGLCAIDENRGRKGTNETPFPRSGLFKELLDRIEPYNLSTFGESAPRQHGGGQHLLAEGDREGLS